MEFSTDKFLFGGDYNPEQWLDRPDILEEDVRMMVKAGVNVVSLGIFSWAEEEPEEGHFEFDWLADIIHNLYDNGIYTILATPSGARPRWLAEKYPEVLRVNERREKLIFGERHNHCLTSEKYREKVAIIDKKLAERFGKDPAVILWHISNEFGGDCHCPSCQKAFQKYVKDKYKTVENLNNAWWTRFWSHNYTSFDQVESPSPIGESSIQGLTLDWKRFVSDTTIDFMNKEVEALRAGGAEQPVTTNMMHDFDGINYGKMGQSLDVISWDSYPTWQDDTKVRIMENYSMTHDFMRCIKDKPFLMMESCTSGTNWQPYSDLKAPGQYTNEAMNAIAHGSESVQIFQIRQGRGSTEKLHGALIDHYGKDDTRVYKECEKLGNSLKDLKELLNTNVDSKIALIYDVENKWAAEGSDGPRNEGLPLRETAFKLYHALCRYGVNCDVIDEDHDISKYKILILPMIYSMRNGLEEKIKTFVENGGTLVMTYWTGITDENDLVHLGGFPHDLCDVAGLRSEEIDSRPDEHENYFVPVSGNELGLTNIWKCTKLFDLVRLTTAVPLMTYGEDFYNGKAALSVNAYGKGKTYYISADGEDGFFTEIMSKICMGAGIMPYLDEMPENIVVSERKNDHATYLFIQNFGDHAEDIYLSETYSEIYPARSDERFSGKLTIPRMGTVILKR